MAKMNTGERLAVLETKLAGLDSKVDSQHAALSAQVSAMQAAQQEIKEQLVKYSGKWGGMLMVLSALWAIISLSKDWIIAHFNK